MLRRLAWRGAAGVAASATATIAWHTAATPPVDASRAPKADKSAPGLELLVHNISHSDMLIRINEEVLKEGAEVSSESRRQFLARPAFNAFMPVSEAINAKIDACEQSGAPPSVLTAMSKYRVQYAVGLDLSGSSGGGVRLDESADLQGEPASGWGAFHLRGAKDSGLNGKELAAMGVSAPRVVSVYLPLIAVVIPEWLRSIKRRTLAMPSGTPPPRKVVVLVSGAGQPRNNKANPADNSTEGTGWIIERFLKLTHSDIEVVHIPSTFGIFRYDDNVRFVKEQVLPVVEARRTQVVASHGGEWQSHLKVTVCLADGAPARISAIQSAMRSYRPDFLHVWRYKTFWDTETLSEEDVESHTFKKLEMRPASHRSQLPINEKGLVDEMIRYKRQFEAVRDSDEHELGSFWLRKTGKAVLAVLLTRKPDGTATYWRGMNVEVSMPTGTLCAERNAIGNALAADQSVARSDMLAVAVLSVSLEPDQSDGGAFGRKLSGGELAEVALNPLDPCGACMEWLKKIAEVNPDFSVSAHAGPAKPATSIAFCLQSPFSTLAAPPGRDCLLHHCRTLDICVACDDAPPDV